MATGRRGVGWIFAWMARRSAAAYGLVNEAIALVHEQRLGLSAPARRLLLLDTVAASKYLRMLLVALRPSLRSLDDGAVLVALAELGARHRPNVATGPDYLAELLRHALAETRKIRRFCVCVGERKSVVVEALDEVATHLKEARDLLEGRPVAVPKIPPGDLDQPVSN